METDFIPVDYDYFDFEDRNYIKIFGRNSQGKRVCIIDSCPIYLWAIIKEGVNSEKINKLIKKIREIELDLKGRKTKVEDVELHDKNFMGKKVKALKIFATNYKDLHDVADRLDFPEIQNRRGYDLGFVTHYIIEKKINPLSWYKVYGEVLNNSLEFGGVDSALDVDFCIKLEKAEKIPEKEFKPRVLTYDIETDDLKLGEGEILMISLVSDNFKKVITWKKTKKNKPDYVEYVKDEADLIEKFVEYVKKLSPDFLVGYFSDGFDMPYIKARAEKFNVKLALNLDSTQPRFSRGIELSAKTKGIVHIDLLKFIRVTYAQYMQSETLSLNEVAKEFLGDSKRDFKIQHSSKLTDKDWEDYYEYNLQDSVLAFGLFEKFWPDLLEFARVIHEPMHEISRNGLAKQVEGYILHNLDRFNEIPEKRPTYDEIGERRHREKVEGAFVLEPKPGLYENIAMFDFTSMHTSIIISMNISKSTLLEKKEKDSYESPELDFQGKKTRFYFSKTPGFLPTLLKEILEKRKRYKEEYKKDPNRITLARSNAFKLLSASVHGYIGFFGARYHSLESSASILGFVRKFNKEIIEKVKKAGHQVIYGDTDSIAFLVGKNSKDEIKSLLKKLNSELPGVMELGLEGFFKRGIWVTTRAGTFGAKKKYALLGEDDKLKIRGFETVRRDWCRLARRLQNNVIKMILEDGNEKQALKYVKEIIKKIKERKVGKEELIIRTMLSKPISEYKAISPHVIAARKMEEREIPISGGHLIEYFIAETREKKKLVREKVKLPDEKGEYNIEYYLKKQILPAIENIFQIFNINVHEIIDGRKQTKLGDF
ncbi:MAG: DNA-directed DNA polymerase [Candidatus Pacearchaeota archaeon]|nr:DNA-directed DNA polymerase [Candidatus Pacearchaeota archaeon]